MAPQHRVKRSTELPGSQDKKEEIVDLADEMKVTWLCDRKPVVRGGKRLFQQEGPRDFILAPVPLWGPVGPCSRIRASELVPVTHKELPSLTPLGPAGLCWRECCQALGWSTFLSFFLF